MEKTCIIYGSSTGTCQAIAENIAGKLGVGAADVLDVSSIDASTPDAYTNLIWAPLHGEQANFRTTGTTDLRHLSRPTLPERPLLCLAAATASRMATRSVRLSARYTMRLKTAEQSLSVPFRQTATPMTIQLRW